MNTEAKQEEVAKQTAGQRLSTAREALGLSQQQVATRLCLKLSTVKDIETDIVPSGLAATFLRGYICSYARLVHLPEQDLLPDLADDAAENTSKIMPVRSYSSFGHRRGKQRREYILKFITVLIFLLLAGLTFSWWWQNHPSSREELTAPVNHNADLSREEDDTLLALPTSSSVSAATANPSAAAKNNLPSSVEVQAPVPFSDETASQSSTANQVMNQVTAVSTPLHSAPTHDTTEPIVSHSREANLESARSLPVGQATPLTSESTAHNANLQFAFRGDCWIEVVDADGKRLASGIQRAGTDLDIEGKLPYRLTIGAPASVNLLFRKQPVDLTRFIREKKIARLTVGTN